MPYRTSRRPRPAMYNTPQIRNGGFGALQVEALTNRPLSIARRHLAASQLRMRDIEPDELSSSEWVRFLVMQETERERWMTQFRQRRRNSDESTGSSIENDADVAYDKAEEARLEAVQAAREEHRALASGAQSSSAAGAADVVAATPIGTTPLVSLWARHFSQEEESLEQISRQRPASPPYSMRRPLHLQRAVTEVLAEAPPSYTHAVRAEEAPPAYERMDSRPGSPLSP
ncbi:hypothetical protein LTR62_005658 [Meristemomyces frigidus]|uniref:Uncharacterized protein n=1 Tax=Meristemomyces frigidus TaxID=1508187 RepID=A0AAN7TD87_9PEZI|nr:hypothetical protein LTR62_005658 [Meristemomyces frigidus]